MAARVCDKSPAAARAASAVGRAPWGVAARGFAGGPVASELLVRLRSIDTSALCDASAKEARVVATVRPLKNGYRMVGRARTVKVDGDFLEVLAAIRSSAPGEAIMIDASMRGGLEDGAWPRAGAMFGELLASEAERRGVVGMVVDGNCRDVQMLLQMSLPIYCRGRHPNAGTAHRRGVTQSAIQMGGVLVRPGEFVLGDDDGVVVCSEEELAEWLPKAEAVQQTEALMLLHVQSGKSLFEKIPNVQAHLEAVAKGEASKLRFE